MALKEGQTGPESSDRGFREAQAGGASKEPQTRTIAGHLKQENEESGRVIYGTERTDAGAVNVTIDHPAVVLNGIMTSSSTMSHANEFPPTQRFVVTIDTKTYEKMLKNDEVTAEEIYRIKADPVPSVNNEVHDFSAPEPASPIRKMWNAFNGNQSTFGESYEAVRSNCVIEPPATLAEYITKMKERRPDKMRLIPPAATIKKSRRSENTKWYSKGYNTHDGPLVEVGPRHVTLKTDNGSAITCEGKTAVLSGTVLHESNNEIYPQQITGIPSSPFPLDDFLPKGTIVTPHTKRAPAFLAFLQAMLPIWKAVDLALRVTKVLREGREAEAFPEER